MFDFDWAAAQRHFSRALDLNPTTQVRIGYALWFLLPRERTEEARVEFDHVTVNDPSFQHRFEEALAFSERLIHIHGRTHGTLFALGTSHAIAGNPEAAHRVPREMKALTGGAQTAASGIACIHALLEEREAAFVWMDLAIEHRDPRMLWIRSLPWVDALRSDPRYGERLLKLKLAGAMA